MDLDDEELEATRQDYNNLSEKEQEAIEYINNMEYIDITKPDNLDKLYDSRDLILNLISKLQKELKQEKEQVKIANKIIANLQELLVEDMTNENMDHIPRID